MEVILGTKDHRAVFLSLWKEFLREQYGKGGPYLPTDHNLLTFLQMYDAYDRGSLFGGCVFAREDDRWVGLLLGGEDYPNGRTPETRWGKVATTWGVYIIPEYRRKGIGLKLTQAAQQYAKDMGFDTMISTIFDSMPEAVANSNSYPGMEKRGFVVTVDLHKDV